MKDVIDVPFEVATVLGKSPALLKAVANSVPPALRRSRANRDRRREAYLAFQRASLDAMTWANYMLTLEVAVSPRALMIQMRPTLVRELGKSRACLANLLSALAEIRMVGNPKPRKAAEEIVALIGHLYEILPTGRPARYHQWAVAKSESLPQLADLTNRSQTLRRRLDSLREAENRWRRSTEEFKDCLRALGIAHRDFTLTARGDLGMGRRLWQFGRIERKHWYQVWRPAAWPGGWPGPNAGDLIARTKPLDHSTYPDQASPAAQIA